MNDSNYYHIYSDGGRADIPFSSDEDKIFAMNSVAIASFSTGSSVLAVEVNDTHLHSVIFSPDGEKTRREIQRRLSRHFIAAGRKNDLGEGLFLSCDLMGSREDVMTRIIYTFRNCMDFYRKMPWNYDWGVGNLYFAEEKNIRRGKPLHQISYRKQFSLLKTNLKLPQNWEVDDRGLILPSSYVDYHHVEQLFVTPRAFLAFLYVRKEDEQHMKLQFNKRYLDNRSIDDLRKKAKARCSIKFGKALKYASVVERLNIASEMIRANEASKSESLAKAVFLSKDDLLRLL